jgi:hypothetical protein
MRRSCAWWPSGRRHVGRPTAGPAQLPNAVGRDEEINPVLGKAGGILRPGSSAQSAPQPLGLSDLTYPHRHIYRNGCSVGIELSHLAAHTVHSIGQSADRRRMVSSDASALVALVQDVVSVLGSGLRCLASALRTSAMIAMRRPKIDNLGRGVDRWVSKLGRDEFDGRPQIVHLPKPRSRRAARTQADLPRRNRRFTG